MTPAPEPEPRAAAVLVAAGSSTRMQLPDGARKPFLELEGRTVLEHSAAAFDACPGVREHVVVVRADDVEAVRALVERSPAFTKPARVVPGGAERTDSVRAGVRAASGDAALVAVHDAARPLVLTGTIAAALEAAAAAGAALVAAPVRDTIKHSTDGRRAERTLDRARLWAAQTPQVFDRARLLALLERAADEGFTPTDDAALWERYVEPIALVPGESTNLKLTTPTDLEVAAAILRARAAAARGGGDERHDERP